MADACAGQPGGSLLRALELKGGGWSCGGSRFSWGQPSLSWSLRQRPRDVRLSHSQCTRRARRSCLCRPTRRRSSTCSVFQRRRSQGGRSTCDVTGSQPSRLCPCSSGWTSLMVVTPACIWCSRPASSAGSGSSITRSCRIPPAAPRSRSRRRVPARRRRPGSCTGRPWCRWAPTGSVIRRPPRRWSRGQPRRVLAGTCRPSRARRRSWSGATARSGSRTPGNTGCSSGRLASRTSPFAPCRSPPRGGTTTVSRTSPLDPRARST